MDYQLWKDTVTTVTVPVRARSGVKGTLPVIPQSKLIKCNDRVPVAGGKQTSALVTDTLVPAPPAKLGRNVETLLYVQAITKAFALSQIGGAPFTVKTVEYVPRGTFIGPLLPVPPAPQWQGPRNEITAQRPTCYPVGYKDVQKPTVPRYGVRPIVTVR